MKKLILFLLVSVCAFGQANYFGGVAQTSRSVAGVTTMVPLPFASVFVCNYPGACTVGNAATIYTDATGVTVIPGSIVTADANGNFGFWAAPGTYQYIFTFKGVTFGPFPTTIGGATIGAIPRAYNLASVPLNPTPSDGTIYKILDNQRGYYTYDAAQSRVRPISADINVQDFGARGDGGSGPLAACNGTSTISNVASTNGRLPKVGDTMIVSGCGAAGADLTGTITGGTATSGTEFGTVTLNVTAGATASNRGARWGASLDDTSAFSAALTYCSPSFGVNQGGCTIRVPPGVYFVSNLVWPSISSGASGDVRLQCSGNHSSIIVGIGANGSSILKASSNSVGMEVSDCEITNYDYRNSKQVAIEWAGGQFHKAQRNFITTVQTGIWAHGTQVNYILDNWIYTVFGNSIEFGTGSSGDFVTATRVSGNSLQNWSYQGLDATKHAYYVHTADASYENFFENNTVQNDNPPYGEPLDVNDNLSVYRMGYNEGGQSAASGYWGIFRGLTPMIYTNGSMGCIWLNAGTGGGVGGAGATGATIIGVLNPNCPAQTYSIKSDATGVNLIGAPATSVSNIFALSAAINGGSASLGGTALRAYINQPSTAFDFPGGRVDLGNQPYAGPSASSSVNPSSPTQFGTAAVIPAGTIVPNRYFNNNQPLDNNVFWICDNGFGNNCSNNPIVATQWKRFGEKSARVRSEGTAAPVSGTWVVGDFIWNTNPSSNAVLGWVCTTAGTPGTWTAVYSADAVMSTSGTVQAFAHQVIGSGALTSATPSTLTVTLTGAAVFTSNTSYKCALTNETTQANPVKITYTSGSAFTITGPNTVTDTIGFVCTGN